jgi:inner membrane protein
MITISGIPLFYPFFKNPCVMPGNPNFRLNTNNLQQEGIAFVIFLVLGFSLQPLFSDGFFFSVNKQFNSLKYLNVEFKSNKNLNVKYNFERYNQIFDGSGILIFVDEKKAFINDNKKIIEITEDDKINILKPIKTNKNLFLKNLTIKKISLDSLNYLVQNKFFYEIKLYSNLKFTEKNKMSFSQKFDEKLIYNLEFLQQNDTININQSKENLIKQKENFEQKKLNLKQNIQLKELQLSQELADIKNYNFDYERNKQELKKIQSKLNIEKDMYLINEYKNKIIELNHKISSFIPKNYNSTDRLKTQINQLKNDYNKPFIYLNSDEKINTKIEFEGSLIFVEL